MNPEVMEVDGSGDGFLFFHKRGDFFQVSIDAKNPAGRCNVIVLERVGDHHTCGHELFTRQDTGCISSTWHLLDSKIF